MKIDRVNYPYLSKENFEEFLTQLKPIEIDSMQAALEDSDLPQNSMLTALREAKEELNGLTQSLNEIQIDAGKIRSQIETWNKIKKVNLLVSPQTIQLTEKK